MVMKNTHACTHIHTHTHTHTQIYPIDNLGEISLFAIGFVRGVHWG